MNEIATIAPASTVKAFARELAKWMDAECIELEAVRGVQAILRFPALKIELHLSGQMKVSIVSKTIEGQHFIYGPIDITPSRSMESIGRSLAANKQLFNVDRVVEAEQRDAKLEAIVEKFRQQFPALQLKFDGRDCRFEYNAKGLSIHGSFFPSLPGYMGYDGSPFGRLKIDHLFCETDEFMFSKLITLLNLIVVA